MTSDPKILEGRHRLVLIFSTGIFIAFLITSSITAQKLWGINVPFIGYEVAIPVGTMLFAITFLATDVISEVFGRKYAFLLVLCGLACRILVLLFLSFAVFLPPVEYFGDQEAYATILGLGAGRILIAGIIAYVFSQTMDVLIFHVLKARSGNHLYQRNIISTATSQFVDTTVFVLIGFYGAATIPALLGIIFGQLIFKWIVAIVDTPFAYMIANWTEGKKFFAPRITP